MDEEGALLAEWFMLLTYDQKPSITDVYFCLNTCVKVESLTSQFVSTVWFFSPPLNLVATIKLKICGLWQ